MLHRHSLAGHPLELLSIRAAARILKAPKIEVERLIASDQLRSFQFGTKGEIVRVLRLDLEKRLASPPKSSQRECARQDPS